MLRLVVLFVALAVCQGLPSRLRPRKDANLQIDGGVEVDIKDFPWQISVINYRFHICGGSFLNSFWILTSAKCVIATGGDPSHVFIRAGSSLRTSGGEEGDVNEMFMHPQFDLETMVYDVAVMQLIQELTLDGIKTRATILPAPNTKITTGQLLTVSGWGIKFSEDDLSEQLRAVMVPVLPLELCRQLYSTVDLLVDDSMICAGVQDKAFCQGDSGGPLVDALDVQVGVASWGRGCGSAGYPDLYANLLNTNISSWIKQTAGLGD